MIDDLCIYCGHTAEQHTGTSGEDDCDACFDQGKVVICDRFRDEPPEPDGEDFRGGEAAAYQRERMEEARRLK
jgi:hypothetical protein